MDYQVLIAEFPVHPSATAYKKGTSIRQNALAHVESNFTLRMDFKDFFPSFSNDGIRSFVGGASEKLDIALSGEDIEFIVGIVTRDGALTVGAPSSPAITNAMMYQFDDLVFTAAKKRSLTYTRYADDLFISSNSPNQLEGMFYEVRRASSKNPHTNLRINETKTVYLSRKYRRTITGLIVTPDKTISIGRQRKREIKALVHRYIQGELSPDQLDRARGLVAFAKDADPKFFKSLRNKYGQKTIIDFLAQQ